jgi:hypothetical protein
VVSFLADRRFLKRSSMPRQSGAIFAHVSVTDSSLGTRKRLFEHTAARSP